MVYHDGLSIQLFVIHNVVCVMDWINSDMRLYIN